MGLSCRRTARAKLTARGEALSETFLDFWGGKHKELLLLPLRALFFKG